MSRGSRENAVLLYDGACAFCAYWVRYWARLGGADIRFSPFQQDTELAARIGEAECRAAIQLVEPDGLHSAGAAAAFRVLALAGMPLLWCLYRRMAVFRRVTEGVYRAVANRRNAAMTVAEGLWGRERHPARYTIAAALFVRLVALTYVAAFASLLVQIDGLLGSTGILPVGNFLHAAHDALGAAAWWRFPSLLWLAHDNAMLQLVCIGGIGCALLALFRAAAAPALVLCYLVYLSLFSVGQDFLGFQWDLLLLEAGLLAVFLPLEQRWTSTLFRLLLFRFMFLSGCVKLLSGDPAWANLAALDYHYFTQPLPSPLAWYAHHLPAWFDRVSVAATFVIELALPWLIFAPRRPRMIAAAGFLLLEVIIVLIGNYNFFNLLTMALVVFLIDDAQWPRRLVSIAAAPIRVPGFLRASGLGAVALVVALNLFYLVRPFAPGAIPAWVEHGVQTLAPLRIVNPYGLFAVMTTNRSEIIIEGSMDGTNWLPYVLRYNPGDTQRRPGWNIPHQPRLDWQLWFAALGTADRHPWFGNLLVRLLQGQPAVLDLFAQAPWGRQPPRYVRALVYDYHFSTPRERSRSGAWWQRRYAGIYYPRVNLK